MWEMDSTSWHFVLAYIIIYHSFTAYAVILNCKKIVSYFTFGTQKITAYNKRLIAVFINQPLNHYQYYFNTSLYWYIKSFCTVFLNLAYKLSLKKTYSILFWQQLYIDLRVHHVDYFSCITVHSCLPVMKWTPFSTSCKLHTYEHQWSTCRGL